MSSQHRLQDLLTASKAASGLSVREIARKAGLSHGTVSNALRNNPRTHPIPEETLAKLAKGFDLPLPRVKRAHDEDRAASTEPIPAEEIDVPAAILADPHLLPEARAHLLNQYGLLLRIQGAERPAPPPVVEVPTETPGLRIVAAAYDMSPEIARELEVIAKRALEQERDADRRRATGG